MNLENEERKYMMVIVCKKREIIKKNQEKLIF